MPARRLWLLRLLTMLLLVAFAETATRAALALRYGYSFFRPGNYLVNQYYPELAPVLAAAPRARAQNLQVLLLGASVLNPGFSDIALRLQQALQQAYPHRQVQVHNLAMGAHTTRDSRLKYELLQDLHFDLVVVYHGINDTRANNCPPEVFRPDYRHYAFYQEVDLLRAHPEINWWVTPYFLHLVYLKVQHKLLAHRLVPVQAPRTEWLAYGQHIKSRAAFAANLAAILQLAGRKGEPVALASFAWYLAPGYSLPAFLAKKLDYGRHESPVELWGLPANVVKGIGVHNQVIDSLARRHPQVYYADIRAGIPGGRKYFDDICHLTPAGSRRWVEILVQALQKRPLQ
jgi:lysophospholipase L1-like esterase